MVLNSLSSEDLLLVEKVLQNGLLRKDLQRKERRLRAEGIINLSTTVGSPYKRLCLPCCALLLLSTG